MEKIKAEEVDRVYLVHWQCPDCMVSNTDEEEESEGTKESQCWECQTKIELTWNY